MSPAAGDTERSAATSPRSEGGRGRLQEKAQRLAAELDLKLLSVSKRTAGLQGERALSPRQASPFLAGVERRDASPARILQVTPNSPGLARSDASPVRIVQASPISGRGRQDASPRIAQASRTAGQREALPPARILQESSPRRVRIAQEPAKTVGSGNLASLRSENQAGLEEKLEALRGELVEERRSRQAAEAALAEKLHEKLAQLDGLGQAVRQLEGTHVESSLAKDLTQVGGETSALRAAVEVLQTKLAAAEEGTAEMQTALSDLRLRLLGCEAASSALKVNLGDLQAAAPAGQERLDVDRSDLWRVAQEAQAGQERLRQECAALETRLGQAISQQAERSWENLEAVRREMESGRQAQELCAAQRSGEARREMESICEERILVLASSYAEVKKEVTAIEETWTGRLDSLRASQDSLQTALKSVEEETVWQRQLAGLRAELSQEVQEATAELSKNIVACQGRLSSARLDTHDKMQALEERVAQGERRSAEAKEAWTHAEPALRQVHTALREVAELRDFTMDQASRLQNNITAQLSTTEAKVQKELASTRDLCTQQAEKAELAASKVQQLQQELPEAVSKVARIKEQLQSELGEAVAKARAVAEELARELLQERQRREAMQERPAQDANMAKQLEELQEKLVNDLMASEARLRKEESSIRQFTSDQAAQLWVSVEDLQAAVQKLTGSSPSQPKADTDWFHRGAQVGELSVEEVKQFETVRVTPTKSDGDTLRKSPRQHREELLQRLTEAESKLQRQQGLMQKQKQELGLHSQP